MQELKADGLLNLAEAAAVLGVSKATLRRWTGNGILVCVRVGPRKDRRFYRRDLDKVIESQMLRSEFRQTQPVAMA